MRIACFLLVTAVSILCAVLLLDDSSTRYLIGPGRPDLPPSCYTGLERTLRLPHSVARLGLAEAWIGTGLLLLSPLAGWIAGRALADWLAKQCRPS